MIVLRRLLVPLVVLLAAWPAGAAQAAFPGRNGQLVVQPLHGGGLLLSSVHGTSTKLICTDARLCGSPSAPHFSPDGQDIVFATGTVPAIVAADGSCLWCRLGTPLTTAKESSPAFTADGRAVTGSLTGGLDRTTLAGVSRMLTTATETQAVWSSRGARAFVRAGAVWFVPAGSSTARRLVRGAQPAFAPNGLSMDYARSGWIWTVRITGGMSRRVVKGSHPAISPDGHQLAFVTPAGRIALAGIKGRHARAVPGLRGRAVDWQPLPRSARVPCPAPAGAAVLAQSAEAIVTQTAGAAPIGCLAATGRRTRLIVSAPAAATSSPAPVQTLVAGRYVVLSTVLDTGLPTCTAAVTRFDLATGRSSSLYSRGCGTRPGAVDELGLDTSGFSAWHASEQVATGQPLVDITCTTSSFCLAVDGHGNVAETSQPTGPGSAWTVAKVAPALSGVGCHDTTVCVGLSGGTVTTSSDPAAGPGRWSTPVTVVAATFTDVACPSDTLCAAVDSAGDVVTSTNPTGGASAWQAIDVTGPDALQGISCPSVNLCVAVGQNGDVVSSTNPAGGPSTWSRSSAETSGATLTGVSCPDVTLCVATDSSGNFLSNTAPTTGGSWSATPSTAVPHALGRPACPSVTFCIAPDTNGDVVSDQAPGAPTPAIAANHIAPALEAVGCAPNTTTCVATDTAGNVLSSTTPTSSGPWSAAGVDTPPCGACVAEQLYVSDDDGRQALDSRLPGPGRQITGATLAGDATTVTWSDAGAARTVTLR